MVVVMVMVLVMACRLRAVAPPTRSIALEGCCGESLTGSRVSMRVEEVG